jgi:hypothetical protein
VPAHPSDQLKKIIGLNIATQMVAQQKQGMPPPPTPAA